MNDFPALSTGRLLLRRFTVDDAPVLQRIVSDYEIALNTLAIPHPYPEGGALDWIRVAADAYEAGQSIGFAITLNGDGTLVGGIGLTFKEHDRAEAGYWIGKENWNRGYATEALCVVIDWGFRERGLNRIEAVHFTRNPPSGRVMAKAGMTREGTLRQWVKKWGEYLDVDMYAVVRNDWEEKIKDQRSNIKDQRSGR